MVQMGKWLKCVLCHV